MLHYKRFPPDTHKKSVADDIVNYHLSKSIKIEESENIDDRSIFFVGGPVTSYNNLKFLEKHNGNFINIDKGYISQKGKQFNRYWRLSYNSLQQDRIFDVPDDRLNCLKKIDLKSWNDSGKYILLLAPNPDPLEYYTGNRDVLNWCLDIKSKILEYTDRKVFIRFKDNIKRRQTDPLIKYLDECYAVVSLQSIACVETIINGIPTFNLAPSCLDALYISDISQIEKPPQPENRYEWLKSLSYGQFNIEEIENGTAIGILKDLYEL